jgi:hypothetical protein
VSFPRNSTRRPHCRGHTWTEARIRSFRDTHNIPVYVDGERMAGGEVTMEEPAAMLPVSNETFCRLIANRVYF